ncbi:putative orphan protein [Pseudoalteromonas translucida]|uniref:Orphan protein n=3 Tax=Pseudoalteromonas TaxID=53246 RepID=Q3IEZ7_PSET1|nr:putative orphan protein [Pseudoalteromonas translucida]
MFRRLARWWRMSTITIEGVETQEVHDLLKGMNADHAQGYLYAKPLAYDDYLQYLNSQYNLKMLDSPF